MYVVLSHLAYDNWLHSNRKLIQNSFMRTFANVSNYRTSLMLRKTVVQPFHFSEEPLESEMGAVIKPGTRNPASWEVDFVQKSHTSK